LSISCAAGNFALAGEAASLAFNVPATHTIAPVFGAFSLTGEDSSLQYSRIVVLGGGVFALTGFSAGYLSGIGLGAADGVFALAGQDAAYRRNYILTGAFTTFGLSGETLTGALGWGAVFGYGVLTLTGEPSLRQLTMPADTGAFAEVGSPAVRAVGLSADFGAFSAYGWAAILSLTMPLGYGVFSASGGGVPVAWTLIASSGQFSLVGMSVIPQIVAPDLATGWFHAIGQDADLFYDRVLHAGYGAFAVRGTASARNWASSSDYGAFVLTGENAALLPAHVLLAGAGVIILTGENANVGRARTLYCGYGRVKVSGGAMRGIVVREDGVPGVASMAIGLSGLDVIEWDTEAVSSLQIASAAMNDLTIAAPVVALNWAS
jgi:hypothetical protein